MYLSTTLAPGVNGLQEFVPLGQGPQSGCRSRGWRDRRARSGELGNCDSYIIHPVSPMAPSWRAILVVYCHNQDTEISPNPPTWWDFISFTHTHCGCVFNCVRFYHMCRFIWHNHGQESCTRTRCAKPSVPLLRLGDHWPVLSVTSLL